MGATMGQEVESLLQSMNGLLHENVDQMKSQVESLEDNVVSAIRDEKNEEISLLNQKIELKELKIKELMDGKHSQVETITKLNAQI